MRIVRFLPVIIALAGLTACAAERATSRSDDVASGEDALPARTLTEADLGEAKELTVEEGPTFAIELAEDRANGHEWRFRRTLYVGPCHATPESYCPEMAERNLGAPFQTSLVAPDRSAIGSSLTRRFSWRTVAEGRSLMGRHLIELELGRSADPASAPARTVTFLVKVSPEVVTVGTASKVSGRVLLEGSVTAAELPLSGFVDLLDVTQADGPSVRVGRQAITVAGLEPVAFEVTPPSVDPRASYVVAVHLDADVDGRVSKGDFLTTEAFPVLTNGHGTVVDVTARRQ
jgi:uncharacterized lipoprotein YbaY